MIEGESGILACSLPGERPEYQPAKRKLTWPNGAVAFAYSAEKPDRLRGPQHEFAWADEVPAWQYAQEVWDMLMFGMRLGKHPRTVVTCTPKPLEFLHELKADKQTYTYIGSTHENRDNLPEKFFSTVIAKYEGTRLGDQEIHAKLFRDDPDALWDRAWFERPGFRIDKAPELAQIMVAVDPAASNKKKSNKTGIIVVGKDKVSPPNFYVLGDYTIKGAPAQWADQAIAAYQYHEADCVVAELNQGGDMVKSTLEIAAKAKKLNVSVRGVFAKKGKRTRAEPISLLYKQGRVFHVGGANGYEAMPHDVRMAPEQPKRRHPLSSLEDQYCTWKPGQESPDRLDAAVWAITKLEGGKGFRQVAVA